MDELREERDIHKEILKNNSKVAVTFMLIFKCRAFLSAERSGVASRGHVHVFVPLESCCGCLTGVHTDERQLMLGTIIK